MIKIYYKLFRDAVVTVKAKLKESKDYRKSNIIKYIFQLFIIRFLFGNPTIRNSIKIKKSYLDKSSDILKSNPKSNDVVNSLHINGCSEIFSLKEEIVQKIQSEVLNNFNDAYAFSPQGEYRSLSDKNFLNYDEIKDFLQKEEMYIVRNDLNFKNSPHIKKTFTSPFFMEIAHSYLNTKNITFSGTFVATNLINKHLSSDNENEIKNKSAQLYHRDVNYKKFFKIGIYLTNVESERDGAHVFIPGSHSKCLKRHIVTDRYDSKDIEANYKKKIYTGDAGSLFFVDTFGIHKGSTAIDNFRTVIFLEYGRDHVELSKNAIFL